MFDYHKITTVHSGANVSKSRNKQSYYYSDDSSPAFGYYYLSSFYPPGEKHNKNGTKNNNDNMNGYFGGSKEPLTIMNGKSHDSGPASDYVLELHDVSYIRSFTTGKWYNKIFNPPITAQFLKDINLELHGGEIMGISGSGGCGKTTLLNVIARRVQGTTGGTIMLNHRPMTERIFQNNCAYVSFKQFLIKQLTVKTTLQYHAELSLSSALSKNEKNKRVMQIMRDFELMDHSNRKIEKLSESARRRLLIAIHLIRDPMLVLIDEPTRGVDPLIAYQLMYVLSQYVRKYNRMAMVTMSIPRSDIYPLLDRLTILFFGEVFYSGYTKLMPQYFRNVGFPCPASENPAVYFLSLASVDRETSERYLETQDQAVKLIEIFKNEGENYSRYIGPASDGFNPNPYMPLSQLGRPQSLTKFLTLFKRNFTYYYSNLAILLLKLFSIPLFTVLLFLFYFRIKDSPTSPQTVGGLIFNSMTLFSLMGAAIGALAFAPHRTRYYQESWDNMYGGVLFICVQILAPILLDLVSTFGACAIIYWGCNLVPNAVYYVQFAGALWCCLEFAQLHVICIMMFVKSAYKATCVATTLLSIYLIAFGGFLKHPHISTFVSPCIHIQNDRKNRAIVTYQNSGSDWLHYVSYASIYRFVGAFLQNQQLKDRATGCTMSEARRLSSICRWENGTDYLNEIYKPSDYENANLNFGICFVFVGALAVLTVFLYGLPMPHFVKRKFRYK